MKQKLYSLYDNVAEQFGPIFQAANNNTAARSVQNMKIRAWQDFELYLVGEWDMETGALVTGDKVRVDWASPAYQAEVKSTQLELLK